MAGENKKYSAFISYKHGDLDTFAAENLHRAIETFQIPKNIRKKTGESKLDPVFRDKDELPISSNLADNISNALQHSEYLIVICSPRTPESYWVQKEIETFIGMHDREHVLAVLIEGEPDESFPEQLRFAEQVHKKQDGTVMVERIPVEPLAADLRSIDKKELKKKLKEELLRIMAPLLGCGYDDLRQRHRERKMRRTIGVCAGISACFLAFGLYSTYNTVQINQQYRIKQMNQSRYLAETSQRLLREGDRELAVKIALEALPDYMGSNDRPYVAEAEYALSDALGVYADGNEFRLERQLVCNGNIKEMTTALDRSLLAVRDSLENIYIWDAETYELLFHMEPRYDENNKVISWHDIAFNGQNQLICVSYDIIECYDSHSGEQVWSKAYSYIEESEINQKKTWMFIHDSGENQILDALTGEVMIKIQGSSPSKLIAFSPDCQYVVYDTVEQSENVCFIWNLQTNTSTVFLDENWHNWGIDTITFAGKRNIIVSSCGISKEGGVTVEGSMVMYDVETQEAVWRNDEFSHDLISYYPIEDTEFQRPILAYQDNTDVCRINVASGMIERTVMPFYVEYVVPLSEDTYFVVSTEGLMGLLSEETGNFFSMGQIAGTFDLEDCILMNEHFYYRNTDDNKIMISSRMLGESFQSCGGEESYYSNTSICSADGAYIVIQASDKLQVLSSETYDLLYEKPLGSLNGQYQYRLYQDTNRLIYYYEEQLNCLDLATGEETEGVLIDEEYRDLYAFSRDGSWFASGNGQEIIIYDTSDFSQYSHLPDAELREFMIHENGGYAAGRKLDGTFGVYDTATGRAVELEEPELAVVDGSSSYDVTFTIAHSQPWAAVYGTDQLIHVIDMQTGKTMHRINVNCAEQSFMEFTLDDAMLLVADIDASISVYDLNTGMISKRIPVEDNNIVGVSYLPESELCILVTKWRAYLLTTKDSSYTMVANIPGFLAMNEDTNKIYVSISRHGFGYFIYQSLDNLIQQGQELVNYEELTELEKKTYNVE